MNTPTNLTAEARDGRVILRCDPVQGASGYAWYRSLFAPGVSTAPSESRGNTQSPELVDSADNGTTYYYSVTAVDATGEGPHSAVASATPQAVVVAAPAAPTPTPAALPPVPSPAPAQRPAPRKLGTPRNFRKTEDDGEIRLTWNPVPEAQKFHIFRLNPDRTNQTFSVTQNELVDKNVAIGQTYVYTLHATTTDPNFVPGDETTIRATPRATAPAAGPATPVTSVSAQPAAAAQPPRTIHLPAATLPGPGTPASTNPGTPPGTATPPPIGVWVSRGLMTIATLAALLLIFMLVKQLMSDGPTPRSLGALGAANTTNTELTEIHRAFADFKTDVKKLLESKPPTPSQPQSPAPTGLTGLSANEGSNITVVNPPYPPGYTGQPAVRAGARQYVNVNYGGGNSTPQQSSTRDITIDVDHQDGVKSGEWRG